jgi:hypothetical protein
MTEEASFKGHSIAHNPQGNNKALSGHQPQGAEAAGASEEGMGISPESSIVYLSGTIIRGTLNTPNSQLVTPISIKLQRPDGYD